MDNRRLYQQVADRIRGLVDSGQFPPGSRLPAERDLAHQLGVSRPSLREAIIALEITGHVEARMGSGIYVCAGPDRSGPALRGLGESPSELMQARIAVEGSVVVLACARMTAPAATRLRSILDLMRADIAAQRRPLGHDREFHLAIAAQAGNGILADIVARLFDERHSPLAERISVPAETGATWRAALHEHEAIVSALEAGDPLLAQAAMGTHLRLSLKRWDAEG